MSSPPIPRDVQDFQFKLVSRYKVFNKTEGLISGPVNALAVSSKHGLVFVASPSEIQIFETSLLLENRVSKGSGTDVEVFNRRCIPLNSCPSHIGISCDQVHVAVAIAPKDSQCCAVALIYPITSFMSKDPSPAWELRLCSTPGITVRDLVWNPGLPQLLCICLSNGSVSVYELKGTSQTFQIFSLPESTLALSVSWSPKGKQLVIGSANGTLSQFKPDLKLVKTIPAPPPNPGISPDGNIAPVSLLWLSSFQFAVVYGNPSDNGSGCSRPGLHIVNAPKGGAVSYLNYDDICYSSGELRPIQYYLTHQSKWNILLMSSANSTEVGVLAADGSGGEPLVWEQWALEDASRAELPLSSTREEMYAIGMAIDKSSTVPLPWGENQTIPPAPLLIILSHHGLLCAFNMINFRPGAAQDLCSPPELIPGIRELFVNSGPPSSSPALPTAAPVNAPAFGALPVIGGESSAFPMTSASSFSFAPSSQSPSSLFSSAPPSQSFASLSAASTTPLFGAQTQKADTEKGWLSGQGGSTFGGFGGLGSTVPQSKEETSSSAASSFSFAPSSASTAILGNATTTVASLSNQSQAAPTFAFGEQPQPPTATQMSALATQLARPPTEGYPSFGAASLAPKPLLGDKGKMGGLSLGLTTSGKLKFGSTTPTPESDVNNTNSGVLNMVGSQQSWTATSTGLAIPKVPTATPKAEVQSTTPVSNIIPSQPQTTSSVSPVVSEVAIFRAIVKETELFEMELNQLKERDQKLNIEIGSPAEKKNLVQKVDAMDNFLCELSETTHGQASEIAALRTLLVEAFAWVEEARSRQLYSKNPRYLHLAMNQGLDPVIKKHLLAIRNRIHYLDTQLNQIDYNLDNQWSTFQNTCSKRSRRKNDWSWSDGGYSPEHLQRKEIHMPSLEYVYQTILSQQQVLERHKTRLDELEAKLKDRAKWELGNSLFAASSGLQPRKNRGSPNTHKRSSLSDQDLSSMAESLLALQLGGSKLNGGLSAQYGSKHPLLPKKMSSRHTSQLCHILAHRPMTRVLPSPRSISSSAVLYFPANLIDSMAVSPKIQANTSQSTSVAISSDVLAKPSTPVEKEIPSSKSLLISPVSLSTPAAISSASLTTLSAASMSAKAPTSASSPAFGISVASISNSMVGQSVPAMNYSAPSRSSPAPVLGFSAPGMGSLAISSSAPVKASAVPALGSSIQGIGSFSLAMGSSSTTSSLSPATTTSTPVFSSPTPAKSTTLQAPSGSIFGGMPSSAVTTTSSEGNMWAFSTSGSFSIGSSAKPGGISTGKPVVPPVAAPASPFVPTTTTSTSTPQAFSLNFSVPVTQASKSSFSLGPKPLTTQTPFSLPSSTFGLQNASASSVKEPLFVFGGSSLGTSIKAAPAPEEPISDDKKEETHKEENEVAKEEERKEEIGSGDKGVIAISKEKSKQEITEKLPTTFSFGSTFGSSTLSFGNSSPLIPSTTSSVTVTPSPAIPLLSTEYEDITPENKAETSSAEKVKPEEKPPPARSLFSEFNFKLSDNKSEIFGAKPPASIFGGSSTPAVSSSPIASSLFGTPIPTAASPLSLVTTTSATATLPIISQAEPPSTASNPLSSLGNIVASLGSNTFNKPTTETNNTSNTFSSFSFSLPSKDDGIKSLSPDATKASPGDSQKTPVKAFPAASPTADSSSATTPVAASLSSGTSDFGQGLANILGQSLPSSSSPAQQQSVQNPFAGTSGLFGSSSSASSPSTTLLFGKPTEGTQEVGLFGQSLKQDGTTTSFFGSSSNTAPATTSAPTFGSGSVFCQGASPSASIFSGSGFGASKPVFGQTAASTGFSLDGSAFGQSVGTSSSTPSIFGTPPASTSGANPFQAQATASSSVFGSSSSGDNRGSVFGSVAQSGFGSPGSSSFQAKPGGFGGSPVFGAMGSGNTSPSFGGAATFGSPPAFGGHVFGSGTGGGGLFGSGLQSQGTAPASNFENLATAQTLTFGNLAQSGNSGGPFGDVAGASASQTPATFGSAGASGTGSGTSSFGGSSFTSWR